MPRGRGRTPDRIESGKLRLTRNLLTPATAQDFCHPREQLGKL